MKYQTYVIEDFAVKNIYYFLKDRKYSENFISNLRKTPNSILLNGKACGTRSILHTGDVLEILSSPNPKTDIKPCILPLDIVYEDAYYLLLYKESGISCMPNKAHYDLNLAGGILNYMKNKDENFTLRIINRLDKDTAGFILVAKNSIAMQEVKNISKSYFAICEGEILHNQIIDKKIETISCNGINQRKRIISSQGKDATTYVTPLTHTPSYSYIKLTLEHGRTHQIRLHLSSIGHPLLGDEIYGRKSKLLSHTALVCNEFSFYHPYKEQLLSFTHSLPSDFNDVLQSLNLTPYQNLD